MFHTEDPQVLDATVQNLVTPGVMDLGVCAPLISVCHEMGRYISPFHRPQSPFGRVQV